MSEVITKELVKSLAEEVLTELNSSNYLTVAHAYLKQLTKTEEESSVGVGKTSPLVSVWLVLGTMQKNLGGILFFREGGNFLLP